MFRSERHRRGAVAEAAVQKKLMEMGHMVSIPTEEAAYDMVVDDGGSMHRVQIKLAWKREDREKTWMAEFRRMSVNTEGTTRKTYDAAEVDAFAIYNPDMDEVYWLWYDETPEQAVRKISTWREDAVDDKIGGA